MRRREALVLVPARGGSDRIKHKNTSEVGGESLVRLACKVARRVAAHVQDADILCSTDSSMIADHVHNYAPLHFREGELAGDIPIADLLKEVTFGYAFTILLEPTCPQRNWSTVVAAYYKARHHDVGVCGVHREGHTWVRNGSVWVYRSGNFDGPFLAFETDPMVDINDMEDLDRVRAVMG